jgi:hypothetical protein
MERDLLWQFHMARRRRLAEIIIEMMIELRPGGLFNGQARCRTLLDEACWALQESQDDEAVEAAEATIYQFCSGFVSEMLLEEIRLHCYFLVDDNEDDGMPCGISDAVLKDLAERVTELACGRNLSELELT